jgi:hypothetical protein
MQGLGPSEETMASMGFATYPALADVARVRVMSPGGDASLVQCRQMLGNSIHLPSVGIAMMVATASCHVGPF